MKNLIIALLLGFASMVSYAEEAPAYMKDGKIVVTLKSGKTYEYSTNEWMVVRRGAKKLVPVDVAASPDQRHFAEPEHNKNRVRLMGGIGPVGLKDQQIGSRLHIETKYGLVGGLGYDRQISNKFSLGVAGYTNGTARLGVGLDF